MWCLSAYTTMLPPLEPLVLSFINKLLKGSAGNYYQ